MNRKTFVAILAGSSLTVTAWAWAQQGATPQQPSTGSTGQGVMGQQGGPASGGMAGSPRQGGGPGPMMGARPGQGMHGATLGARTGSSLYERPLVSEILSVQQQLSLSADQVRRLQTLRTDFEKEAIQRTANMQVAEVDLSSLLDADQPDLSKVEAQVKKIAALQAELRFARIKTLDQGRAVLSQEQWQKFVSMAPAMGRIGSSGMMGSGMMRGPGGPGSMIEDCGPGGMMGEGPYGHHRQ